MDQNTRHPNEEQLLRYSDGELSAREATEVREHLSACWQCRAENEEFQKVISDLVRYRKTTEDCFPSPPAPWGDIYQRFAEVDVTPGSVSFVSGMKQWLRTFAFSPRRWSPVMAGLLVVSVVVYELQFTPTVQAAQLLQKAVAASQSHSSKPRRIRIKTRTASLTRVVSRGQRLARISGPEPVAAVLEAQFKAAHYDWDNPLSAQSYAAWHDQLPDKTDQVTLLEDSHSRESDCYQIRTSSEAGELAQASMKIRVSDLRPVESTFEFRNHERVEITDLGEDSTAPPASRSSLVPPVAAESKTPERVLPRAPESLSAADELKVFAALRRLDADLGEPIEVKPTGDRIVVSGIGIPLRRQKQIQDELVRLPRVKVEFSDPTTAVPQTEGRAPSTPAVNPTVILIQAEMEKQLGGRASFEQFSDQVLDSYESMLSRMHALRRLAERFTPEVEAGLPATERRALSEIRQQHATAFATKAAEIERRLNPVLAAAGGAAQPPAVVLATQWQTATEDLFRQARYAETLLAVILGGAASESVSPNIPSQVLSTLIELRAKAEAYRSQTAAAR